MVEPTHLRWKLAVPDPQEEALCAWLEGGGSSAFYREADPPRVCYAYFQPGQAPPEATGLAAFPGVHLLEAETFGDEDWLAKSREGFGDFEVGSRFHVRPLWDPKPGPQDRLDLVVNPGLAFGTGGHETTRLCMELLEELAGADRLRGPILDIGAGTGILSLAAFLLGGQNLTAFDIDPDGLVRAAHGAIPIKNSKRNTEDTEIRRGHREKPLAPLCRIPFIFLCVLCFTLCPLCSAFIFRIPVLQEWRSTRPPAAPSGA